MISFRPRDGTFPSGKLSLDDELAVPVTLERPGFLRCVVSFVPPKGKALRATAGAGFSPLKIAPSLPVPDDFDAFWADQKQKLREMPLEPELTSVEYSDTDVECFDVQIPCLGASRSRGISACQRVRSPRAFPQFCGSMGRAFAVRSWGMPPRERSGTCCRWTSMLTGFRTASRRSITAT